MVDTKAKPARVRNRKPTLKAAAPIAPAASHVPADENAALAAIVRSLTEPVKKPRKALPPMRLYAILHDAEGNTTHATLDATTRKAARDEVAKLLATNIAKVEILSVVGTFAMVAKMARVRNGATED